MGEEQHVSWLLSIHSCSKINSALQELTGVTYELNKQYKDPLPARIKIDEKGARVLLLFLQERDPFSNDASLWTFASGIVVESTVNADCTKEVAKMILAKMVDNNPVEFSFTRKDQAITQNVNSAVKLEGELIYK